MSRALIQKGGRSVEPKKPGLSKREVMLYVICHQLLWDMQLHNVDHNTI